MNEKMKVEVKISFTNEEFQEKEDEKHWTNSEKPDAKTFEINQKYETYEKY